MQRKPRMYFDAGNFIDMGTETSIWPWGETPSQVMIGGADKFFQSQSVWDFNACLHGSMLSMSCPLHLS